MKRLLAYLIVVISLGLTFNVSAEITKFKNVKILTSDLGIAYTVVILDNKYLLKDFKVDSIKYCQKNGKNYSALTTGSIFEGNHPITTVNDFALKDLFEKTTPIKYDFIENRTILFNCLNSKKEINDKTVWIDNSYKKYQTQIAKIEPTVEPKKKVKVAEQEQNEYLFNAFVYREYGTLSAIHLTKSYNSHEVILLLKNEKCKFGTDLNKLVKSLNYESSFDYKCSYRANNNNIDVKIQDKVSISIYPKELIVRTTNSVGKKNIRMANSNEILSLAKLYKVSKLINLIEGDTNKTQIAKKEPTVEPKKTAEVAKVEPKQEEFTPKKTNQDNEAPVIEIAEAITVDSQAYTLKGKVKDKSQIYLTINGRQVEVTKGTFELDRFSIDPDNAEEIKIVAIDQWNNRSEKTVKVTIDLQSSSVAKVYEGLQPNNIKVKTDNNKIAIIIGIEKYANLKNLDAKYANRDAQAFRTYATRALGIEPSNIKMLIDDKATRSQALKAFKLWLPKIAGKGGKDIHIFFAGHGLASDNGEDLYILPQDGESSLLEDTAISRVELISLINKVNPRSVTMFFDTCYSGQTRDERMLVASLRPIRIVADEQETPDNFTIFTASNYDQTSGSIEEAKHGMFSYYLMKGLEGNADNNKDKKITNGELIAYLKNNVSQEAFTQNRQQDPMLAGDPDKILISYQ
jgi:hypothetical protein